MIFAMIILSVVFTANSYVSYATDEAAEDKEIYYGKPAKYTEFITNVRKYPGSFTMKLTFDEFLKYYGYSFHNDPLSGYSLNYRHKDGNDGKAIIYSNTAAADKAKIAKGKAALDKITCSGSQYEKARTLYIKVGNLIKYKTSNSLDHKTIYAAHTKRGDCQAYSKCYKYLCNKYGIPCETVTDPYHMWNIVKINGKWYNVDLTWYDDGGDDYDNTINKVFLVSDNAAAILCGERETKINNKCPSDYKHPGYPKKLKLKKNSQILVATWVKAKNSNGTYYVAWKYKGGSYKVHKVKKLSYKFKVKKGKTVYVKVKTYDGFYTDAKSIKIK